MKFKAIFYSILCKRDIFRDNNNLQKNQLTNIKLLIEETIILKGTPSLCIFDKAYAFGKIKSLD